MNDLVWIIIRFKNDSFFFARSVLDGFLYVWRGMIAISQQHVSYFFRIFVSVIDYFFNTPLVSFPFRGLRDGVLNVCNVANIFVNKSLSFDNLPSFLLASWSFENPTKPCLLWLNFHQGVRNIKCNIIMSISCLTRVCPPILMFVFADE